MKIKKFTIRNFRSIKKLELEMNDEHLITIVGQNETGKTSLLRALAWWGGDPSVEITKDDIYNEESAVVKSEVPIVTAETAISSGEATKLISDPKLLSAWDIEIDKQPESEEGDYTLLVAKYFDGNYYVGIPEFEELQIINADHLNPLIPRFIYFNIFEEYIGENSIQWTELLTKKGWKNVAMILGIGPEKHKEISDAFSPLNYFELQKHANELTRDISDKFEIFWYGGPKRLEVSLTTGVIGISCVELNEDGREIKRLKPSQMSEGFRWSFCLNTKLEALTREQPDRPLFLLLDEPNTSLSGDQQRNVLQTFEEFCKKGNSIVFSTHSPFLVDLRKHILVMELENRESKILNLNQLHGQELLITLRAALHLTLADSLFFGKQMLLVEGITDRSHIQLLVGDKLEKNNISIMELGGTRHMPIKLEELEREGLLSRCTVFLNSDQAGISTRKQAKQQLEGKGIHLPIYTIPGEDIEDLYSRNDFLKICEGFLDELKFQTLKEALGSFEENVVERGRMKKAAGAINIDPGIFKLRFLTKTRELGPDALDMETRKHFDELIKRLFDK